MTKQDFSDLITSEMHHSNIVWSPERLRDLLQKKYYAYDHNPFGKPKAVFTIFSCSPRDDEDARMLADFLSPLRFFQQLPEAISRRYPQSISFLSKLVGLIFFNDYSHPQLHLLFTPE
jgi:hypothetical protein